MLNYILILSSVVLNSIAQILIRKGMLKVGGVTFSSLLDLTNILSILQNIWLWLAMLSYVLSIVLWMMVLSKVQVSFAYPFLSIGYIVAAVIGFLWLGETFDLYKIAGIAVICFGIIILSRSGSY